MAIEQGREIRKGTIISTDATNRMGIDYQDGGAGVPLPRWFFGGIASGLHVGAAKYDQAAVLRWGAGLRPIGAVPITDYPERLAALGAGEVLLYGPTGTALVTATATTPFTLTGPNGATIAFTSAGGIVLTPAAGQSVNVVTSSGGTLQENGTTITVP